jgi:hypothetical protein
MGGRHPHHRPRKRHGDIPQLLTSVVHGVKMTTLEIAQMCGRASHPMRDQDQVAQRASGEPTAQALAALCGEVRLIGL